MPVGRSLTSGTLLGVDVCRLLIQGEGRGDTRSAPAGDGHKREHDSEHEREDLDRALPRCYARDRESRHMLEVAVDHYLTIDAQYRSGQAPCAEHERGFDEEDQP